MTLFLLMLLAAQAGPDAKAPVSGAKVFAQQCSVPYCHGAGGAAARAPALAGRNFARAALRDTILKGRPKLGMPSFAARLDGNTVDALVSYILALPAPAAAAADNAPRRPEARLSKEQAQGRDLFFDSERLPSCGACHAVQNAGGAAAGPIPRAGFNIEDLEKLTAEAVTVEAPGETPFVGLRKTSPAGTIRVMDIDSPLPVLRTFRDGEVKISTAPAWSHAAVVRRYSPAELKTIAAWLRAVLPA